MRCIHARLQLTFFWTIFKGSPKLIGVKNMAKVRDPLLDTTEGMEIFTSLQGARGVSVNTLTGNPG